MMRRALFLFGLAFLAAACQFEMNANVSINTDGSGTITYEIGFDDAAAALIPQGALDDPVSWTPLAFIPGAEITELDRGGLHYYVVTVESEDIAADIEEIITRSQRAIVQEFTLSISDDRMEVTARANASAVFADVAGMMPSSQLEQLVAVNLMLTLPGEIIEHDADSSDGNTLTWSIPVTGDEMAEINVLSNPAASSGQSSLLGWLLAGAGAALFLAGALFFFARRSRRTPQPDEPPPLERPEATE
jgi:hypothetical protein